MTDLRKAAEMALAKLDHLWEIGIDAEYKVELLPESHALRQALAQPEQEPVAWVYNGILHEFDPSEFATSEVTPLYTAPPKREWVGLTDDELKSLCDEWQIIYGGYVRPFAETIEAKLKEKNT